MTDKNSLIQAFLHSSDIHAFMNMCADFLGDPVLVSTLAMTILEYSDSLIPDDLWSTAVQRGYITLSLRDALSEEWKQLSQKVSGIECLILTVLGDYPRVFFKLVYENRLIGYMCLVDVSGNLEQIPPDHIQTVIDLLAKWLGTSTFMVADKLTREEEVFSGLLDRSYKTLPHFYQSVQNTVFENLRWKCRIGIADLSLYMENRGNISFLKQDLRTYLPYSVIIFKAPYLYILANAETNRFDNPLLGRYLVQKKLVLGFSTSFRDPLLSHEVCDEALTVLKYTSEYGVYLYEEFQLRDLLEQTDPKQLMRYCHPKIRELSEYDRKNQTSLFETYFAWLKSGHSYKEASAMLGVHRNTISYRLARIEELFGLQAADTKKETHYMLSCTIVEMLQDE